MYHLANSLLNLQTQGLEGQTQTHSWGSLLSWEAQASKTQSGASGANQRGKHATHEKNIFWARRMIFYKNIFQSGKIFCRIPTTFRNGLSPAPSWRPEPWKHDPGLWLWKLHGYDVLPCYLPVSKKRTWASTYSNRKCTHWNGLYMVSFYWILRCV